MLSCGYSPWETKINCNDNYLNNLQRLAQIETTTLGQPAFKVALLADLHNEVSDIETVVDRINQRKDITFAIIIGDMTNQGLAVEYEWACKALSHLEVPRFYVIGNHDSISFGKEIFKNNFAPFDYSFTYKDVKFILYNDNAFEFHGVPNYTFLKNEAAIELNEVRRQTIGVSHVPPITDAHTEEEATELRQFLFDNNFNLTLHGHYGSRYWLDEFAIPHHITSNVKGGNYSLLLVADDGQLSLQNCTAICTDAILGN